jgi:hypothetical protein
MSENGNPMWQPGEYGPARRSYGSRWGWLAGALVVLALIAIVFGVSHGPTKTAMNEPRPTAGNLAIPAPAPQDANPARLTPPASNPAQTSPAAPAQ